MDASDVMGEKWPSPPQGSTDPSMHDEKNDARRKETKAKDTCYFQVDFKFFFKVRSMFSYTEGRKPWVKHALSTFARSLGTA